MKYNQIIIALGLFFTMGALDSYADESDAKAQTFMEALPGNNKYDKLKNLFNKGKIIPLQELVGWHAGLRYEADEKNIPLPALLIVEKDAEGPLFAGNYTAKTMHLHTSDLHVYDNISYYDSAEIMKTNNRNLSIDEENSLIKSDLYNLKDTTCSFALKKASYKGLDFIVKRSRCWRTTVQSYYGTPYLNDEYLGETDYTYYYKTPLFLE